MGISPDSLKDGVSTEPEKNDIFIRCELSWDSQERRWHTPSDILYVSHADFYYPYAHAFCLLATYLVQEASKMIAIIKTK